MWSAVPDTDSEPSPSQQIQVCQTPWYKASWPITHPYKRERAILHVFSISLLTLKDLDCLPHKLVKIISSVCVIVHFGLISPSCISSYIIPEWIMLYWVTVSLAVKPQTRLSNWAYWLHNYTTLTTTADSRSIHTSIKLSQYKKLLLSYTQSSFFLHNLSTVIVVQLQFMLNHYCPSVLYNTTRNYYNNKIYALVATIKSKEQETSLFIPYTQ